MGVAGGDTFTVRAYSEDVVLHAPFLREVGHGVYAGTFFVADPGTYTVDIYWTSTAYAGWFDLNHAQAPARHATAHTTSPALAGPLPRHSRTHTSMRASRPLRRATSPSMGTGRTL